MALQYFCDTPQSSMAATKKNGFKHLLCHYSYLWWYDKCGWYVAIPATPCQMTCNSPDGDRKAKHDRGFWHFHTDMHIHSVLEVQQNSSSYYIICQPGLSALSCNWAPDLFKLGTGLTLCWELEPWIWKHQPSLALLIQHSCICDDIPSWLTQIEAIHHVTTLPSAAVLYQS